MKDRSFATRIIAIIAPCVCFLLVGCIARSKDAKLDPARPILSPNEPAMPVMVKGEVGNPGAFAWTNGISASAAVQMAGGLTDFAPRTFSIIRADGTRELHKLTSDRRFKEDIALNPGDMVYIHRQ